jgi:hypothetical protein
METPLRGRLMVGRLTLDQVVKVRILAPQPQNPLETGRFIPRSYGRSCALANRPGRVLHGDRPLRSGMSDAPKRTDGLRAHHELVERRRGRSEICQCASYQE